MNAALLSVAPPRQMRLIHIFHADRSSVLTEPLSAGREAVEDVIAGRSGPCLITHAGITRAEALAAIEQIREFICRDISEEGTAV